ncbi:hypothetical protein CPHO_11720 [Corynebacterium phocae]|uniref:DUF2020 domain-containing protein n=2 Tax=Corynebacterium phocae TaxID=161895 RepID=A0A1L7D5N1_9CORY|nr:DUF2020 domain-containing protein [Corynebacterium phocae]APT93449.1 hypothetical protein CPHO_11720 [Corynebacterium phocae]KAA8721143.1 DUF2020 domain-containing protein [Corynebacterium phocae]
MRLSLLTTLVALTLAGCSAETTPPTADTAPTDSVTQATSKDLTAEDNAANQGASDKLAPNTPAEPLNEELCPYLDTQWVANTNGQKMTRQATDPRFETPACIFWSYPDAPQATVIVRHLDSVEQARAAVDWAAPIDGTEPVSDNGWEGGRGVLGPELAVYAVQKGPTAVLVWTNQVQTLKAELIAQEAIKNLGL